MRVLIIGSTCYLHVRRWAEALQQRGVDVVVLSTKGPTLPDVPVLSGCVLPIRPWRLGRWVERRRSFLRRVWRETKPDIIHLHFPGPYSVIPEDLPDVSFVVSTWGSEILLTDDEPADERARKIDILNRADQVLATSQYLANKTSQYAELPTHRVEVEPWGVDLTQFRPQTAPTREPTISFVKHLEPEYGPDDLLQAFAIVQRKIPRARLIMAGTGKLDSDLKEMSERLGIAGSVEWPGHVSHKSVPQLFARSAISVMPSISESFGVAALESQALKVPVVATNVGGIPEVVVHQSTGLLVNPGDVSGLADALLEMLSDERRRRDYGEQGRDFVEQNFNWETTVNRMLQRYNELWSLKKNG